MIDNKTIRKVIMLNKLLPSGSPTYEEREASGAVANFTTNVAMPFVSLDCEILPIQEGTGTPSPSNPRPISGTSVLDIYHSGADTSEYDTTLVSLGQEIIGGTADVVGGVGSKTMAEIDLGDLLWTKQTMQNGSGFTARIEDGEPIGNVNSSGALCEIYPEDISVQNPYYIADETFKYGGTYFGKRNVTILDSTKENMTASEFKTAMTGIKFAYPLETPTDFTFTGQPINSYLGVNNVWTDSGNTKVTYKYKTGEGGSSTKKYLPIFYDFYGKGCRHL